tara:strand:- start:22662 stop:23129 length:468 start_codon:yes stop_codon:yes gene_type:complete
MQRSTLRLLGTYALSVFAISACASLGTPEDQEHSVALWKSMQGYQDWAQFEDFEGIVDGDTVHGDYVQVWVNDIGAADPAGLPYGTIIVKEGYDDEAGTDLNMITVMHRIEGYDVDHNDWYYASYSAAGKATNSGAVSFCIKCHDNVNDYVYFND